MVPWMLLVVEVALALAIVAGLLALVIRPASEARSPGEPSAPDAAADAATDDPRAAA